MEYGMNKGVGRSVEFRGAHVIGSLANASIARR